jgi:transaldolase
MKIYVDTADVAEARRAAELGFVDGITTNPSLVARSRRELEPLIRELAEIVQGDVWCQVQRADAAGMAQEALEMHGWAPNVVVKLPMSLEGLQAASRLATTEVRTNMTLVYSVPQALLAAKAGVSWVSPYVGRMDDAGIDGADVIGEMAEALAIQVPETQVLVASVRGPRHVADLARRGVGGFTMSLGVLLGLLPHAMTDAGLAQFMADVEEARQGRLEEPPSPRVRARGTSTA